MTSSFLGNLGKGKKKWPAIERQTNLDLQSRLSLFIAFSLYLDTTASATFSYMYVLLLSPATTLTKPR